MNRRRGSASDPLWYKDAIIYELHVKAFADANADGIGDFQGLIGKLDYLQALGITCVWLLPFFPSPLRDDGYDIADYMDVHPSYGSMEDFKTFLAAAHDRDLQVMIELVINHTSDQHPWFQAARNAPPGSPERDFYVWSDSDQKYNAARIIFTDTEKSNWTWDPVAKAYFWHRFFSHQPDLNYDNPQVLEEILRVMRFWLDLGVDGLRLDAIPYLIERDGTNCENLPETHVLIKKIRAAMDADYSNRAILAEANQWPSDVRPYFGDGDECHMAFHFPVMPRMYMALRQEDRLPIVDIMKQTPDIPETCQWGMFLRNHDELTLEMVTNDERDYMYLAYSADPRMRINVGIRRRLASLMDNNRRRIELLNSLLFSLPGTPIIYYGDEIGMGDNIHLGDRDGVRTPMQWNADRNAGFSRANPALLYRPVIMDAVSGYQAVNVEAQEGDPSSLLGWMRNMIAVRKLFRVFGRGTLRFLTPANRKVLAYLRTFDGEQVLCVANLSRSAQPVELDLSEMAGASPVEMLGYVEFPAVTRDPYRLTLGPYGFFWLELHGASDSAATAAGPGSESRAVFGAGSWGERIPVLEEGPLARYVAKQRWFGSKSRSIKEVTVLDWTELGETALMFLEVTYDEGDTEIYFAPLLVRNGVLLDALEDDGFCITFLELDELPTQSGSIAARFPDFNDLTSASPVTLPIRRSSAEQSNSSVIYGNHTILKIFRRQHPGPNPEVEIGQFLATEVSSGNSASFTHVPPFRGSIEYVGSSGVASSIAVMQGFVENEGDGWSWTATELEHYFDNCSRNPAAQNTESVRACIGPYLEAVALLGRRTAAMHTALASSDGIGNTAFSPERFSHQDIEATAAQVRAEALETFDLLKRNLSSLPDDSVEWAGRAMAGRAVLLDRLTLPADRDYGSRIRIHGDFHLGQVLRTKDDFVILDFEGEPARPLDQRRAKYSPLKDVAGMLRSFSYAASAALMTHAAHDPDKFRSLEPWARLWEETVCREFLRAWRQVRQPAGLLPATEQDFEILLDTFVLEKAMYELRYELNNRPAWVRIPLAGLLALVRA